MPPSIIRGGAIHFGPFLVTSQVFYLTRVTFALVNLKPILPGHVLVCPRRVVPRVKDLNCTELTDFFLTTQLVAKMIERVYGATSLNIAIQDGKDAGQSVPHVHAHIIPRRRADLDHLGGTDAVYEMMDGEEGDIGLFQARRAEEKERHERGCVEGEEGGCGTERRNRFPVIESEERKARTEEEMKVEAEMLAREMEKQIEMEREEEEVVN